jgi:Protein of unknown function (DUF3667)
MKPAEAQQTPIAVLVPAPPPSASPESHCANCNAVLRGPYCSECGQKDQPLHRSVHHFVEEVAEGLLHFDSKFLRTARALLIRPGFLTNEFIAGRRARYVHPFRLLVIISIAFFACLFSLAHLKAAHVEHSIVTQPDGQTANSYKINVLGVIFDQVSDDHPAETPRWAGMDRQLLKLKAMDDSTANDKLSAIVGGSLPKAVLLLVPIFALLTRAILRRRNPHYIEHLVFSLHVHCFAFIAMLPVFLISRPTAIVAPLTAAACLSIPFYTAMAMRRVYQLRRGQAIGYYVAVALPYSVISFLAWAGFVTASLFSV